MNCEFDIAWRGRCNEECKGKFCAKHAKVKCHICGKQATHECGAASGMLVCGTPLCNNPTCILKHRYVNHGYDWDTIHDMEKEAGLKESTIVVAHIDHGTSEVGIHLNMITSGRFVPMLATYTKTGKIKFYQASRSYFAMSKDEVIKWFNDSSYDETLQNNGLLFYDGDLSIKDDYDLSIMDVFTNIL